jgi:hypothetical protein
MENDIRTSIVSRAAASFNNQQVGHEPVCCLQAM